jgi:hypothetical protein
VLENTGDLFSNLWGGVTGLTDSIVKFVKESKTAQVVLLLLGTALAAALLGIFAVFFPIPAAIAAVLFALQELFGWLKGKDSLLDSIFGDFGSANRKFDEWIKNTKRKITNLGGWIKDKVNLTAKIFSFADDNAPRPGEGPIEYSARTLTTGPMLPPNFAMAGGGNATFTGDIIFQQSINGSSADNASAIASATASALGQGMEEQLRKTSRDLSQ